jgi:hypothetical protein
VVCKPSANLFVVTDSFVQRDMRSFAVDFVAETNLRSLSVKDVKEGTFACT